MQFQFVAQLL